MVIHKIKKAHKHIIHHISRLKKYSYNRSKRITQFQQNVNYLRQFEWKHRNLIFLIVGIIIAFVLVKTPIVYDGIKSIGEFGYIGAFFSGMLFAYALTAAPATAALFILGKALHTPFIIALIAATGTVISDYLIFRFVRDRLLDELHTTGEEILGKKIDIKIDPNGLAAKFIPILAGFIIASPLPDELGVALLGATKIQTRKFIQYSFLFNFIGIFIITSLAVASV